MSDTPNGHIAASVSLHAKSRALEERRLFSGSLCASCRFSHVFRRKSHLNFAVMCQALGALMVPPDIVECSRYMRTTDMNINEMEILALPVDGRIGVQDGSYR